MIDRLGTWGDLLLVATRSTGMIPPIDRNRVTKPEYSSCFVSQGITYRRFCVSVTLPMAFFRERLEPSKAEPKAAVALS